MNLFSSSSSSLIIDDELMMQLVVVLLIVTVSITVEASAAGDGLRRERRQLDRLLYHLLGIPHSHGGGGGGTYAIQVLLALLMRYSSLHISMIHKRIILSLSLSTVSV